MGNYSISLRCLLIGALLTLVSCQTNSTVFNNDTDDDTQSTSSDESTDSEDIDDTEDDTENSDGDHPAELVGTWMTQTNTGGQSWYTFESSGICSWELIPGEDDVFEHFEGEGKWQVKDGMLHTESSMYDSETGATAVYKQNNTFLVDDDKLFFVVFFLFRTQGSDTSADSEWISAANVVESQDNELQTTADAKFTFKTHLNQFTLTQNITTVDSDDVVELTGVEYKGTFAEEETQLVLTIEEKDGDPLPETDQFKGYICKLHDGDTLFYDVVNFRDAVTACSENNVASQIYTMQ